jgi:hypothetical protein
MIIDIRIVRVVFDCVLKTLECRRWVALLHVYTSDLDEGLGERRDEFDTLVEIGFSTLNVPHQELERSSEVECLSFAFRG